jgi:hypothetical protein
MKQNNMMSKSALSVLALATMVVPSTTLATGQVHYNTVKVDGEVWTTTFRPGADVCAAVRKEKGSCFYIGYDARTKTHCVETSADRAKADRLIDKDTQDKVLADFAVPAGANHREAVAARLQVSLERVVWLSGDTEWAREYQYEAILLVLDAPKQVPAKQDRLIVKNAKKEVVADFQVNRGTDHVKAVAEKLHLAPAKVEWLSGDSVLNQPYGYEAILLVR